VDKQKLTEAEAKLVFYQLLQGVKVFPFYKLIFFFFFFLQKRLKNINAKQYLHDQNIAHRDLKVRLVFLKNSQI